MTVLIRDDFSGSGQLGGRTPDGVNAGAWTSIHNAEQANVSGGMLSFSYDWNIDASIPAPGSSGDVYIEARVLTPANPADPYFDIRLGLHHSEEDIGGWGNAIACHLERRSQGNDVTCKIALHAYSSGSFVDTSHTIADVTDFVLRLETIGTLVRVLIDGVEVLATDVAIDGWNSYEVPPGTDAYIANFYSEAAFDYVEVGELGGDPPAPPEPTDPRNCLIKEKIYTKGQAGQAYRAPKPARTVMETRTVCAYRLQQGAPQGKYVLVPADPSVGRFEDEYVWVATSSGVVEYVYSCQQEQVAVYYPADPGQAYIPTIAPSMDYQLGWNAGARSLLSITNHGQVTFQAGASNIGAVCGLNTYEDPLRHDGGSTRFAWHMARGTAKVMERGNVRTATFAYTDSTVFKVRRLGEKITYWMDDELVYTSTEASTGPLWLQASLYSGDDYLFNPKMEVLGLAPVPGADPVSGSLSIALPSAGTFFAAGTTTRLRLALPAPAPSLGIRDGQGVLRLHLPEPSMHASDGFSARLRLTLPQAVLAAGAPAVAVPAYAILKLVLMPAIHDAYGLIGATGQLNMGLPIPDVSLSDKQLGRLSLVLPPQLLRGRGWPADELPFNSSPLWLVGLSSPSGEGVLHTDPMAAAALGSIASYAEVTLSAAKMTLQAGGSLNVLSEVILATVPMTLIADGRVGVLNELNEVFVLAVTGEEPAGTTQYENYPFNSFARIGGRDYGASVDGLYLLEGDDDAGQPISAAFGFGELDFGKSNVKTVSHCYLGAAAGAMRLEVQALLNGAPVTYSYAARGHGASLRGVRFDLGRGLRSTYVMPTFYNIDGEAFEVDAVRFLVADSARRI